MQGYDLGKIFNAARESNQRLLDAQKKLSSVTNALLVIMLKNIRRASGVYTSADLIEENLELKKGIEFIKNHNYFIFLVMTRQFHVINEVFFEKSFSCQRYFAYRLRRAWLRLEQRHRLVIDKQKDFFKAQAVKNHATLSMSPNPIDLSTLGLSNKDILFYSEKSIETVDNKTIQMLSAKSRAVVETPGIGRPVNDSFAISAKVVGTSFALFRKTLQKIECERIDTMAAIKT